MSATGVPSNVYTLVKLESMMEQVLQVVPAVETAIAAVRSAIIKELEDRAVGMNVVTTDALQACVASAIQASGLMEAAEALKAMQNAPPSGPTRAPPSTSAFSQIWSGCLPASFQWPKVRVQLLWQLWMCGSSADGIPAYRFLACSHFPLDIFEEGSDGRKKMRNKRKKFGEGKFLCNHLSKLAISAGGSIPSGECTVLKKPTASTSLPALSCPSQRSHRVARSAASLR